jgi:hypothetical protein
MTTLAPPYLFKMYALIRPHLSSLRVGGIVGDTRHVAGGGYHISREDLRSHGQGSDYSIQSPADKRGASNYAAAIDISLDPAEMVEVSKRLKAAMGGADYDPRIEPLREFIGTVDNVHVCGYNRYQTVYPNGSKGRATGFYPSGYSESSHLWHVHLSFFRDYCNNWNDILGVAEVVCGLKAGALGWKSDGAIPAPKPAPAPTGAINLWTIRKAHAYDGSGHRRTDGDLRRGRKVHGVVDSKKFNDGRYLRVGQKPHRLWYPLDGGTWSHSKSGKAI